MRYFTRVVLEAQGFEGFVSLGDLRNEGLAGVPDGGGVYDMLRELETAPAFLEVSPAGWFKQKDPTVAVTLLESRWVEGCHAIYIGKADRLRRRLREFLTFGTGRPIGHWGGRLVWQVEGPDEFVIGWKTAAPSEDPRELEKELLARFRAEYGSLPLANLVG